MELRLSQYITRWLQNAHYEYDSSVHDWVGWIKGYPGIYVQGRTIEDVRDDLVSVLEEFILLDLKEGKKIPGLSAPIRSRPQKISARKRTYTATTHA